MVIKLCRLGSPSGRIGFCRCFCGRCAADASDMAGSKTIALRFLGAGFEAEGKLSRSVASSSVDARDDGEKDESESETETESEFELCTLESTQRPIPAMASLLAPDTKIKVSSVLQKDVKNYGKQYLTDSSDETCWNSDQGSPQFIAMEFSGLCCPSEVVLMFQGGFVGKECELLVSQDGGWVHVMDFYPEDSNSAQSFAVPEPSQKSGQRFKIVFKSSTDFYGRITVYKLDVLGSRL
ncbi:galactose-binding domain-like protein [Polychytrium aggregatum]|uniref:galactose-binding domain-like protein n=1 Tax=Polychytrium aggregatum TaxID=110093 RepID=UPI0022FE7440|nr:galactose-binding domain-like protein [Polychytrium aggregatum]KAI9207605.1 galactose-binding domain-like protein [Polychytrium aggregatum]